MGAKRKGLLSVLKRAVEAKKGVSRSTIARQMAELDANGADERIYIKVSPKVAICYYRLKD